MDQRLTRKITLSAALIDEIVAELRNLISMMEPYYSQCDAQKDADDLIDRLEALAEGKES